jgi:hypothetical protein
MLNDNGTIGNAMGDIRNLYKSQNQRGKFGMKHSFLPTTVVETPDTTITMEDDIDVAIVKLMMSYKGYTGDDVCQQLKGRVNDLDAVKPTIFMLNMNGFFDVRTIKDEPVYTLRRGKQITDLEAVARKTKVRAFKAPEVHVVDPNGVVRADEGVDIGIWKAMSDRKWRALREVVQILKEFGLDFRAVDRRLDTMVRSNRWFDRQGTGGNTFYRLKAHIECPVMEQPKDDVKAQFTEEAPQAAAPAQITVANPTTLHDLVKDTPNAWTIPPQMEAAETVPPVKAHEDILPGDSLNVAIWKVMSDREEYTVNEIGLLLADYGLTMGSVSPTMSLFSQKGYADRREVKPEAGRSYFVYRLKDIPMPDFPTSSRTKFAQAPVTSVSTDAQLKDAVEQFNQTPAQPEPVAQAAAQTTTNETKEQENMSKSAQAAATSAASAAASAQAPLLSIVEKNLTDLVPLLSMSIEIKGISITLSEFGQLYKGLRAEGFQAGGHAPKGLLEKTYAIKGTTFTHDELNKLVGMMSDLGLNFQKAVTL